MATLTIDQILVFALTMIPVAVGAVMFTGRAILRRRGWAV